MGASRRAAAWARLAARLCRAHGFVVETEGPAPPAGAVVVANHLGYMDPLVLASLGPSTCIAKSEVAGWPLVGTAARRLGIVFVERGCPWSGARALRQARRLLRAGVTVTAFPEGTTTWGDEVLPFKRGLFGLARLERVPVVAAAIRYDDDGVPWVGDTAFVPHYARLLLRRRRRRARVVFAPALDPRRYAGAEPLAAAARAQIAEILFGAGISLSA